MDGSTRMKFWSHFVPAALTLPLLLMAASVAQPTEAAGDFGLPQCRFTRPADFVGTLHWDGGCVAGLADGRGVLRGYLPKQPPRLFFGRMRAGQLAQGVVKVKGGFLAGVFEGGKLKRSEERADYLQAFDEAAAAAREASVRFRKAGNEPSARFYGDWATKLAAQMD